MTTQPLPIGPDPRSITRTIQELYPDADVAQMPGAAFFSLDAEAHWPNFATIVTTDDFDHASNLSRPGVFRLNLGLGRATFERLVGSIAEPDYTALDQSEPDYTALDRIIPHPVYAKQRWISILNPSERTFREVVLPLLAEAHDRLAAKRTRATSPRPGEGKGLAAGRSPDHRP